MIVIQFLLLAALAAISAAQCPFSMMSGDVTSSEIMFQASFRDASCRKTTYSDYAVGWVYVDTDKDFSRPFYQTRIVTKHYGDNPRTDPGEYVARVHLKDLDANTTYYYKFVDENNVESPTGIITTLPSPESTGELNFLQMSCANVNPYPISGALRNFIVQNKPQFNIFNGDVIYADRVWYAGGPDTATNRCCRFPNKSQEYYMSMYDQQRDDSYTGVGFHESLYSVPTFMLWDDHEVTDDFAGNNADPRILFRDPTTDELVEDITPEVAKELTTYGRNAFFTMNAITDHEVLSEQDPAPDVFNPDERIFRKFKPAKDAEVFMLDLRSYREPLDYVDTRIPIKPDGVANDFPCTSPGRNDKICFDLKDGVNFLPGYRNRTTLGQRARRFMGDAQKKWFKDALLNSTAKFKFVVSSVVLLEFFYNPPDRWEAYWDERMEIINFIQDNNIENVIILTGDYHASIFAQVNPGKTPPIYEFTTGSIGNLPRGVGTFPQFYDWFTYYGGQGHTFPEDQRPVKFMYHQAANFMHINLKDGKLTIRTLDANGEVAVDLGGVRGEFIIE